MARGGQNASKFMSEEYDKRKEVANVLGLRDWLCFTTIEPMMWGNGIHRGFRRVDIYTGKVEVREMRKWKQDFIGQTFSSGWINEYLDSIYGA